MRPRVSRASTLNVLDVGTKVHVLLGGGAGGQLLLQPRRLAIVHRMPGGPGGLTEPEIRQVPVMSEERLFDLAVPL